MMWPFASRYPERGAAEADGLEFDYIIVGGESNVEQERLPSLLTLINMVKVELRDVSWLRG